MLSSASEIRKSNKRQKTDKKDAQWIADLFKHDLVNGSLIPPKDIRQLRDLCRYWVKLSSDTTGKKNRAQNCLTVWSYVKKKYKLNVTNFLCSERSLTCYFYCILLDVFKILFLIFI